MTKEQIIQNIKTRISTIESYHPEEYALNKGILFELKDLLSMIEKDESSLPSNLDEAAMERMRDPDMYLSTATIEEMGDELLKMAHFGAEWMAEQGVSTDSKICKLAGRAWVTPINEKQFEQDVYDNFASGDEVIVQIRKK